MGQIFGSADNFIFRAVLIAGLILIAVIMVLAVTLPRSPSVTGVGMYVEQAVPFSHQHHAGILGIDCGYCHTSAGKSSFAGIPATETCMKCHRIIWNSSAMLRPVRESFATGRPMIWKRVHNLPDFVYFNHSIHVQRGISCQTCHGDMRQMPLTRKEKELYMGWCLSCHTRGSDKTRITQITNCSTCHR